MKSAASPRLTSPTVVTVHLTTRRCQPRGSKRTRTGRRRERCAAKLVHQVETRPRAARWVAWRIHRAGSCRRGSFSIRGLRAVASRPGLTGPGGRCCGSHRQLRRGFHDARDGGPGRGPAGHEPGPRTRSPRREPGRMLELMRRPGDASAGALVAAAR